MNKYFHQESGLPDFSQFTADKLPHVVSEIEILIKDVQQLADSLAAIDKPNWDNVVAKLAKRYETLGQLWGVVGHLHGTQDSKAVREVYNTLLPLMSELSTWLAQHQGLCAQWKKIISHHDFAALAKHKRYALKQGLNDFCLSGADLSTLARKAFMLNEQRLAELAAQFSENVLDETKAFSYDTLDKQALKGLPENVLERASELALSKGAKGYSLTLQGPDYLAVMEYADEPQLREHFYRHYVTRASDVAANGGDRAGHNKDNSKLMSEMLELREKQAKTLGFADYSELSLAKKMATSHDEVEQFLKDLAKRTHPFAEKELNRLKTFASSQKNDNNNSSLMPWDLAYYSRALREQTFSYTEEEIKPYFPAPTVINGVFSLCKSLFNIDIVEESTSVWDSETRFYRIIKDGKKCGGFYADLYARDNKRSGAWMDEVLARGDYRGAFHYPVAYLVGNFSPPVMGKPALLTMDEVITLLHETGHVLHHVLSEVDELPMTGIRGVEWDAVELPSQFMENFAWNETVLTSFSAHVETGEKLPKELFDKLVAAKNFQSGLAMLRQLEYALFDWRIHHQTAMTHNQTATAVAETINQVRHEIAIITPPSFNRYAHSFSHIFAGGYSAGYYSYKWAEVLSCDGFGLFEEYLQDTTATQPQTALTKVGNKLLKEVLAVGGTRAALESFIAFRGRAPDIKALMLMNGLAEKV